MAPSKTVLKFLIICFYFKLEMKKALYIFILVSACILANGQTSTVKKQKTIDNQNCIQLKGIGCIMNEDLPVTDVEFTKYISTNYSKKISQTTVELNVVFQQKLPPCCRRTIISDSTKIDLKQIDKLTTTVLSFPGFNKIKFVADEKAKYLIILIFSDKNGNITTGFLPAFSDKRTLH